MRKSPPGSLDASVIEMTPIPEAGALSEKNRELSQREVNELRTWASKTLKIPPTSRKAGLDFTDPSAALQAKFGMKRVRKPKPLEKRSKGALRKMRNHLEERLADCEKRSNEFQKNATGKPDENEMLNILIEEEEETRMKLAEVRAMYATKKMMWSKGSKAKFGQLTDPLDISLRSV